MDWKKLLQRLLFPPLWLIAVLTVFSAAALAAVFARGWEETAVGIAVYPVAFYTLVVACIWVFLVFPAKWDKMRRKINESPMGNRYMTDRLFRWKLSLYLSLGGSLMYVGVNLWSWYYDRSWWFVVLAVYYVIMAVMRLLLTGYVRKKDIGESVLSEWRRARSCAWILLLVNLSLSAAVLMILYRSKGYDYPGVMIYVMALYTFYSTIHAVVEIVRSRKMGSPVLSAGKIVSLSAALVSMLNLETAMFNQFGDGMRPEDQRLFIILTGAGISAAVVSLSVYVIIKATKELRREKYGE